MTLALLYGSFLYFPKNKLSYIPAVLQLLLLLLVVVIVFRWFIRKSKRDALAAKQLEERILQERERQSK